MECVKWDADLHNRQLQGPRTLKKRKFVLKPWKFFSKQHSIPGGEYFSGCIEPVTKHPPTADWKPTVRANASFHRGKEAMLLNFILPKNKDSGAYHNGV